MAANRSLNVAQRAKKDDFYTLRENIENELKHYRDHFRGKIVYCNCDDPTVSNFFHYFENNFIFLGLKKLITTCYKNRQKNMFSNHNTETSIGIEYTGGQSEEFDLKENGDFRSAECIELLKHADVVVTNPPFSLFREYVAQLIAYKKRFLIIGNMNAISTKAIFPLIQHNKVWLGLSAKSGMEFYVPADYTKKISRVDDSGRKYTKLGYARWFTNLEYSQRYEDLILYKQYSPEEYPKYDNYDGIEVSKTADIPEDYEGEMGVPISFLDKHNPEQFEIVGADTDFAGKLGRFYVKGKRKYARIVIRNKRLQA